MPGPDGPPVPPAPGAAAPPMNIAFVANGVSMVDALSVGAAAGRLDASVLTTRQDRLVSSATTALEDLDPQLVFVVGGDIALADTVIEEIATATGLTEVPLEPTPTSGIVRVAGSDRYATSAAVAGLANAYDPAFAMADAPIPVAVGFITSSGALTRATPSIESVVWDEGNDRWRVSFHELAYFYSDYATQATLQGIAGEVRTGSVGGDLLIYPYDSSGAPAKSSVSFTVFQPPAAP